MVVCVWTLGAHVLKSLAVLFSLFTLSLISKLTRVWKSLFERQVQVSCGEQFFLGFWCPIGPVITFQKENDKLNTTHSFADT